MKVLLIGGTGFVGSRVTAALAGAGHDVTVLHRGVHEPDLPPTVRHVRDDRAAIPITDYPHEVLGLAPDVAVHMVPMGAADAVAFDDAFRGRAGRAVAISSGDVYRAYGALRGLEEAPAGEGLLGEDAPLRTALHPYGRDFDTPYGTLPEYDKVLVERALAAAELPTTVLRLPRVYGPGDGARTLERYLRPLDERGWVAIAAGEAGWRWTHGFVDDVAAAIVGAVESDAAAGRTYNVGESPTPTVGERVEDLIEAVGIDGEVEVVPDAAVPEEERLVPPDPPDLAYDTARIRAEVGWSESAPRREALVRTAEWLRASRAGDG